VADKKDIRGSGYKYFLTALVFSEPLDTVLIKLEKSGRYEDERYVVEVIEMN
jgi:hypothetical protein